MVPDNTLTPEDDPVPPAQSHGAYYTGSTPGLWAGNNIGLSLISHGCVKATRLGCLVRFVAR